MISLPLESRNIWCVAHHSQQLSWRPSSLSLQLESLHAGLVTKFFFENLNAVQVSWQDLTRSSAKVWSLKFSKEAHHWNSQNLQSAHFQKFKGQSLPMHLCIFLIVNTYRTYWECFCLQHAFLHAAKELCCSNPKKFWTKYHNEYFNFWKQFQLHHLYELHVKLIRLWTSLLTANAFCIWYICGHSCNKDTRLRIF